MVLLFHLVSCVPVMANLELSSSHHEEKQQLIHNNNLDDIPRLKPRVAPTLTAKNSPFSTLIISNSMKTLSPKFKKEVRGDIVFSDIEAVEKSKVVHARI
ncbi:hypothetical protein PACTADRAFT_2158 [Pachysolen tannophilus NRRL Y-2460]|uniref:Uncharacterized protein n=1 Tax=Pachysolen tannophilus NRRL Y-2460 TaxID=669874 RepID=A0A1E4TVT8_PACTA|nr:hypothetical protein PACTADRAFT_2158 [Pachysolen tannophilus NRRL Y-2460]